MSVVDRVGVEQEIGADVRDAPARDTSPRIGTTQRSVVALPSSVNGPFVPFAATARSNRWSIVTLIAAMVVISFAILYESNIPARPHPPENRQPGSVKPVQVAEDSRALRSPDPASTALPEIVDIVSDQPLVGDGRKRELFVLLDEVPSRARDAGRGAVESVESHFVKGDAVLRSPANIIDVSHGTPSETKLPAGLIGLKTARPVSATFEFSVTLTDGRRSKPFRKTFNILPMPATAPSIVDVATNPHEPSTKAIRVRANASCTRSTCGSIVLVREIETGFPVYGSRARASSDGQRYEVLVRTDDRAIHAFREPRLLKLGTRARVSDGKLLALNAPPPAHPMHREGRPVLDSEPFISP